jgi:hypothetical protein
VERTLPSASSGQALPAAFDLFSVILSEDWSCAQAQDHPQSKDLLFRFVIPNEALFAE